MECHLRLCRMCGQLATLFQVSILSTSTSMSCHGRRPPDGDVQETQFVLLFGPFRGRNKADLAQWTRPAIITQCDRSSAQ